MRIEKLLKKGKRADDLLDLSWKPLLSVSLISLIGLDLGGTRICFNQQALEGGLFMVGSYDGELVNATFVRPEGDENTDQVKSCLQVRVRVRGGGGRAVSLPRMCMRVSMGVDGAHACILHAGIRDPRTWLIEGCGVKHKHAPCKDACSAATQPRSHAHGASALLTAFRMPRRRMWAPSWRWSAARSSPTCCSRWATGSSSCGRRARPRRCSSQATRRSTTPQVRYKAVL